MPNRPMAAIAANAQTVVRLIERILATHLQGNNDGAASGSVPKLQSVDRLDHSLGRHLIWLDMLSRAVFYWVARLSGSECEKLLRPVGIGPAGHDGQIGRASCRGRV